MTTWHAGTCPTNFGCTLKQKKKCTTIQRLQEFSFDSFALPAYVCAREGSYLRKKRGDCRSCVEKGSYRSRVVVVSEVRLGILSPCNMELRMIKQSWIAAFGILCRSPTVSSTVYRRKEWVRLSSTAERSVELGELTCNGARSNHTVLQVQRKAGKWADLLVDWPTAANKVFCEDSCQTSGEKSSYSLADLAAAHEWEEPSIWLIAREHHTTLLLWPLDLGAQVRKTQAETRYLFVLPGAMVPMEMASRGELWRSAAFRMAW